MIYAFIWCLGWVITARAIQHIDEDNEYPAWVHWALSFFGWPLALAKIISTR